MSEKYGFVYIWYDRWRKMFYIGSHWGTENDGYICSSNRMRDAYRRRPEDFKRRVIVRVVGGRLELLNEEFKWIDLISENELGKKYYNLEKRKFGHWSTDKRKLKTVGEKISASPLRKQRISQAMKGKKPTSYNRQKLAEASSNRIQSNDEKQQRVESRSWYKHSEETKKKMRKPKEVVKCPRCSKIGGKPSMVRFHFDNCTV